MPERRRRCSKLRRERSAASDWTSCSSICRGDHRALVARASEIVQSCGNCAQADLLELDGEIIRRDRGSLLVADCRYGRQHDSTLLSPSNWRIFICHRRINADKKVRSSFVIQRFAFCAGDRFCGGTSPLL
jgi:hypothetical protein